MRINCHSHIFNLPSVMTRETLSIMLRRLKRDNVPNYLRKPTRKLLEKVYKDDEKIDRRLLLTEMIESIKQSKAFKEIIRKETKSLPVDIKIVLKHHPKDLNLEILEGFVDRASGLFFDEERDAHTITVRDYIEFLGIALAPSISSVTDILMKQIGPDDAIVALMMDITDKRNQDKQRFEGQILQTSRQILRYPGRIFPFFAVNTIRTEHFERMRKACTKEGFVGVKLYPSLGYKIAGNKKMSKVIKYCAKEGIPLLQHCNHGGFYAKKATVNYSDPAHWLGHLKENPKLRICFGHFGGDENFVQKDIPPGSWTATILKLMKKFPGQVYADVAYHTDEMLKRGAERNYANNLKKLLSDKSYAPYILWGTDYFLVRQHLRESSYWHYFRTILNKKEFERISSQNPRAFLGLPAGKAMEKNIVRYVDFVRGHNKQVKRKPSRWLRNAIKERS